MRIGILGSGRVGQALGVGFADLEHEVMIASRNPHQEKVKAWVEQTGRRTSAGTFTEVARFAELAVLATSWDGIESAIRLAGPQNLAGKMVIDVINPLDYSKGGTPQLAIGHTNSAGEEVQRWLADSFVVKAFNAVGLEHMVNPQFPGGPPDMFICGNDTQAKQTVIEILHAFGWPVIDLGGIEMSRYLEPLAMIWIVHLVNTGNRYHAFKLLRK